MPVDYRVLNQAPVIPPNSLGSLGRMEAIGGMIQKQRAQEQAQKADQILRQITAQFPDQPDKAVVELRRQGFAAEAQELEKHLLDYKKKLADTRKVELEAEGLSQQNQGIAPSQKLAKEKQFLEKAKPETWMPWLAASENQQDWDNALAAGQVLLGEEGAAILATVPKAFNKAWAERLLIGPEKLQDQNLRQQEIDQKASGVSGSTSDFGSFLANFIQGEAEKLGKTPEELGASWRAGQTIKARQVYGRADDAPQTGPSKTLSATAESNIINRLSNQWVTATKSSRELDRAVSLMDQGMTAARRGDMAQGAQAILVTFQKILDPTSVVRESEYARSSAGLALMDRIQGAYERLAQGGAGVPLNELEKFARLAQSMADAQRSTLSSTRERLGKTADRYSIPRELVTDETGAVGTPQTQTAGAHKEGEIKTFPSGLRAVWKNGAWHEIK